MKLMKNLSILIALTFIALPSIAFAGEPEKKDKDDKEEKDEKVVSERVVSRKVVSRTVVREGSRSTRQKKKTRSKSKAKPRATAPKAKDKDASVDEEVSVKPPRERAWSVRAEAVTDAPLQIGGGLLLETPSRFRLKSSVGVLSQAYLSASSQLASSLREEYPDEAAAVLQDSLDSSFVWRSGLGIRPFRRAGLYGHVGFTWLRLKGQTTGEELSQAIMSINGLEEIGEMMAQYGPEEVLYTSNIHMADTELGWEFTPGDHFAFRLGVGWSFTMRSKSRVTARFEAEDDSNRDEIEQFEEDGAKTLDAVYENFLHPPTLHMGLGFRF